MLGTQCYYLLLVATAGWTFQVTHLHQAEAVAKIKSL